MSKYGEAAVRAWSDTRKGENPVDAWKAAMRHAFPEQRASREKVCPRSVFLGLIDANLLVGIDPGNYTNSPDNKRYAIEAIGLLNANPERVETPLDMWRLLSSASGKAHNGQMHVVAALWKAGAIRSRS